MRSLDKAEQGAVAAGWSAIELTLSTIEFCVGIALCQPLALAEEGGDALFPLGALALGVALMIDAAARVGDSLALEC